MHSDIFITILPTFALQISRWIRQLALTGTVIVGKEKNYKKLEDKHRKLLQKKNYHKFKKGAYFFIIFFLFFALAIYFGTKAQTQRYSIASEAVKKGFGDMLWGRRDRGYGNRGYGGNLKNFSFK